MRVCLCTTCLINNVAIERLSRWLTLESWRSPWSDLCVAEVYLKCRAAAELSISSPGSWWSATWKQTETLMIIYCLLVTIPCSEGAAARWNSRDGRGLYKSLLIQDPGCRVWSSCPVMVDACGWCLDCGRKLWEEVRVPGQNPSAHREIMQMRTESTGFLSPQVSPITPPPFHPDANSHLPWLHWPRSLLRLVGK